MSCARGQLVAVVGAGPAGLAAACALAKRGVPHAVLEQGKPRSSRRHDAADDLAEGVGGAGLFSDGKFSYYPSGTHLYRLSDERRLAAAYTCCLRELEAVGIATEPLPARVSNGARPDAELKRYPSHYASLERRLALIERLEATAERICTEEQVTSIERREGFYALETRSGRLEATAIILATGRFGPLALASVLGRSMPTTPLRYELGVRIESPSSIGFAGELTIPDVKRIWHTNGIEARTFCTCRRGEIWAIPTGGLYALSGRADGRPTEFSNFGLLARYAGPAFASGGLVWSALSADLRAARAIYEPLETFLGGKGVWPRAEERPWHPRETFVPGSIREVVGDAFHASLAAAVADLLTWSPSLCHPATTCLFPAVEGVGSYPLVGGSLRVPGHRVWCAGDVVGRFRGLVPALVSGYYAGMAAAACAMRTRPA
ncbi:MAG TPA: FAD-dependent oxidoreductase [Gaiellaceae bacterium]|nr:FAD-dependent oxidoreductase [Gaiellaceae bacterium]